MEIRRRLLKKYSNRKLILEFSLDKIPSDTTNALFKKHVDDYYYATHFERYEGRLGYVVISNKKVRFVKTLELLKEEIKKVRK